MKSKLDSFLRRKIILPKKAISLLKSHTLPQIWNKAKYEMRKLRGSTTTYLRYEPVRLILFVTLKCNLTCGWCPFQSPHISINRINNHEMQMDEFEYIVNRFNRALWLELSGGEPFLHSHIFEMIDYAHKHRMRIHIPTNGTAIHDMLDRVVRSPISLLNISLNALSAQEYTQLTGASEKVYNRLLDDIPKLIEKRNRYNKGLKTAISYVCHKANYQNIPKMVELAQSLGVDEITFRNLIPVGIPGFLQDQCLYVDDSEVIEVIRSVPSPKSNLKVAMPRLYKREYLHRRCNYPFRILTVYPRGSISPCCTVVPRRNYGSIFTDNDVWNNSILQQKRKILVNESLPLPDSCKTCPDMVAEWRPSYVPQRKGIR